MAANRGWPVPASNDPNISRSQRNAPRVQVRHQIRLRTLLLAVGVCAIPLAAIHYGWFEPLTLFPFVFVGSVAGGIVLGSALLPAKPWARLLGAMLAGGLATAATVVVAVAIHARDTSTFVPAFWASAMMFVPAAIGGGVTCLCWEAFWQRTRTFLPRLRKRVKP